MLLVCSRIVPCLEVRGSLSTWVAAQQPATSGTFILHKFAQPIGKEAYKDRNSPVPLETTFTSPTDGMMPVRYSAKGRSARMFEIEDSIEVKDGALNLIHQREGGRWA